MLKTIFIFVAFLVLLSSADLFLKDPAVWPDEVIITQLGSEVLHGASPLNFGYPPGILVTTAAITKYFGISIIAQRLFIFISAILLLISLNILLRQLTRNVLTKQQSNLLSFFFSIALIVDYTFLKAVKVSRPEILTLLFGSLSLIFFNSFAIQQKIAARAAYFLMSSIFLIIGVLFHPLTLFWLLPIGYILFFSKKILKAKRQKWLILIILIAIFMISLSFLRGLLYGQFASRVDVNTMLDSWLLMVFRQQPWELRISYSIYLISSLYLLYRSIVYKDQIERLLAFILVGSWTAAILGKSFWYFVLPIPFIYLTLSYWIIKFREKTPKTKLLITSFSVAILVITNLVLTIVSLQDLAGNRYSYQVYSQAIAQQIPSQSKVLISTIPDPYYGLVASNKNLILIEFPPEQLTPADYTKLLSQIDYIVINGYFDQPFNGNFLAEYIKRNQLQTESINTYSLYAVSLIKLKPLVQRN
ncbi:MAG: hypothetical protein M1607_02890 [Patescibacteria group bacterium]|nr:hypothetical protein [Patescibacteria group bacterium]